MQYLWFNHKTTLEHATLFKRRGLSLIELIIVLAIFSISLSVVGPNINRFIAHNRISAQINQINGIIKTARHQAIDDQETVILCPAQDYSRCNVNWNNPIIGFIDANRNLHRDPKERLLFATQAITPTEVLTGPKGPIRFNESGMNSSPATLLICPRNGDATLAKAMFVSLQGRVRISKDSNNDGIDERTKGRNLSCR